MTTCEWRNCLTRATREVAYQTSADGKAARLCGHCADALHRPEVLPGMHTTVTGDAPLSGSPR